LITQTTANTEHLRAQGADTQRPARDVHLVDALISQVAIAGDELPKLHQLLQLAYASKKLVGAGFTLSIAYNLIGMYFSTQALLSPMIAAILMPASTISIILLSYLSVHMTKIMSFSENGHPAR
jgi:hypothetical protein